MNAGNADPSARRHWLTDGTVALLLLLALLATGWLNPTPGDDAASDHLLASANHLGDSAIGHANREGRTPAAVGATGGEAGGEVAGATAGKAGVGSIATRNGEPATGATPEMVADLAYRAPDAAGTGQPTELEPSHSEAESSPPAVADNALRPAGAGNALRPAGAGSSVQPTELVSPQPLIDPTAEQLEIVEKLRKEAELRAAQLAREEQERVQREQELARAAEETRQKLALQRASALQGQELLAAKALQQAIAVHQAQGAQAARNLYRDIFASYGATPSGAKARGRWDEVVTLLEQEQIAKNEQLRQQKAGSRDAELAEATRREQAMADTLRAEQSTRAREQAAQAEKDSGVILARAKQLQSQGNLEDAADQFKTILAQYPKSSAAQEAGTQWEGMRETLKARDAQRQQQARAQRQQQARTEEAAQAQRTAAILAEQQRLAEARSAESQRQESLAGEQLATAQALLAGGKLTEAADAFKQVFSTFQDTAAADEALTAWQATRKQVKDQEKQQAELDFQALSQRRGVEAEQARIAQQKAAEARKDSQQQVAQQLAQQRAARVQRDQAKAIEQLERGKRLRADGRLADANQAFRGVLATYNETPAAAEARQLWEQTNAALAEAEAEQAEKTRLELAERRRGQAQREQEQQQRQAELAQQQQAEAARQRVLAAQSDEAAAAAQLADGKRLEEAGRVADADEVYRKVMLNFPKATATAEASQRRTVTAAALAEKQRLAQAAKLQQNVAKQAREKARADVQRQAEAAAAKETQARNAANAKLAQEQRERQATQALAKASELERSGKLEEARTAYRGIVTQFRGTSVEGAAQQGVLGVAKKMNQIQAEQALQTAEARQQEAERLAKVEEQQRLEAAEQRESKAAAEFAKAQALYDRNQVAAAEKAFQGITEQFAGTAAAQKADQWLRNLATARTVLQQTAARQAAEEKRKVEEAARKQRDGQAAAALALVRQDHAARRYEAALGRIDALLSEFAGTTAANQARTLQASIRAEFKEHQARQASLEKEANELLGKAKKLHDYGKQDAARKEFETLVKKYPGTQAAKSAAAYLPKK